MLFLFLPRRIKRLSFSARLPVRTFFYHFAYPSFSVFQVYLPLCNEVVSCCERLQYVKRGRKLNSSESIWRQCMKQFQEIHYDELRGLCLPPSILKIFTSLHCILYGKANHIYRPTSCSADLDRCQWLLFRKQQ
jgi:hypothetical protein